MCINTLYINNKLRKGKITISMNLTYRFFAGIVTSQSIKQGYESHNILPLVVKCTFFIRKRRKLNSWSSTSVPVTA
jgi:hypothetical protein